MAPTWGESRRMHEACERAGVQTTYSHQRRFGSRFKKAKELANDGTIGELRRLEGYCPNLFDWGTHWFDMLFFYNNEEPVEWVMGQIDCVDDRDVFGIPVETNGISLFRYRNDVTGLLITGDDHLGGCENRLIGTEGIIEVGGGAGVRLFRAGSKGWESVKLERPVPPKDETTLAILDSVECFGTDREPELSSRKALQATELIFATYESARRRARVYLPLETEDSALLTMLDEGQIVIPNYPARVSKAEEAEGFKLLFNGRDLSGWKIVGTEEAWSVQKGLLSCNGEGHGWIRPEGTYEDFVLRLQYRISQNGDSGIFLRTSEEGRPAFQGMEIQLLDDRFRPIDKKSTGAIYDSVAPSSNPSKRAGAWNDIEVSCIGRRVRVVLNDKEVVDCNLDEHDDLKNRLPRGFIGLQNHGTPIDFRDVRIKVLK